MASWGLFKLMRQQAEELRACNSAIGTARGAQPSGSPVLKAIQRAMSEPITHCRASNGVANHRRRDCDDS
jgi:hypothetical protein